MTTAKIRPATPLDAEALAELHARVWRATYAGAVDDAWLEERLARYPRMWEETLADPEGATTWLAHRDGRAVGFARAQAVGAGQVRPLELEAIYLDVDEQGAGTADNLMLMTLGDAPAQLWVWSGQDRARAFYRRHGFVDDGGTGTFGPLPTVRMVR